MKLKTQTETKKRSTLVKRRRESRTRTHSTPADSRSAASSVGLSPQLVDGQAIKLVGLGGVGSSLARFGARFLAPLTNDCTARLVLIDGDSFEPSNATRMYFTRFGKKAEVLRDELAPYFVDSRLEISAIPEFVTPGNIHRLLHDGDIVIAAVDNHATRKMISDYCADRLQDVVLISGGNDGVGKDSTGRLRKGTYGNCQAFIRRDGKDLSPSLTRYHIEIREPADRLPTDQDCMESAITVNQLPLANLMAACAILNTLWLYLCGALRYSELGFDIAEGLMRPLPIPGPDYSLVRACS